MKNLVRGLIFKPFWLRIKAEKIYKSMKIRKANKKDIEEIVRLNIQLTDHQARLEKYYRSGKEVADSFRKHLRENIGRRNFIVLVADNNDKLCGFFIGIISIARPHVVAKKVGRLDAAFILKEFRTSGIGKLLFDELLKWFKKNKVKNIELSVHSRIKTGNLVWKKLGFKEFYKGMRLNL